MQHNLTHAPTREAAGAAPAERATGAAEPTGTTHAVLADGVRGNSHTCAAPLFHGAAGR